MAAIIKKCRVCGKEYEACRTIRKTNTFRWQDVACCPEHGSIYFSKILESRAEITAKQDATAFVDKNTIVKNSESEKE